MKDDFAAYLEAQKCAAENEEPQNTTLEEMKMEYLEYLLEASFQIKAQSLKKLDVPWTTLICRLSVCHMAGVPPHFFVNTKSFPCH